MSNIDENNLGECLPLRYLSLGDQSKFVTGSLEQIISFVNNKEKCIEAKWISIIYTLFPYVRKVFKRFYEPISFHYVPSRYQFIPPTPITGDEALLAKNILVIFPTYLFIFSCSRNNKPEKQIVKWIKASQAGMPFPQITENDVRLALRLLPLEKCEMSCNMLEALGYALCLDKSGKFDTNVKVTDLMPATDLRSRYGMSNWTIRILNQLRLAYMNHHSYSVRLAISTLPLASHFVHKIMNDKWNNEIVRMDEVKELMFKSPFYSLCWSVPVQISWAPHVVLFSLCYHVKCFNPGKGWDLNYPAHKAVDKHVRNETERHIIKIFVESLPEPDVVTLAEIFKGLTLQKAVDLAAALPSFQVDLIYQHMESGLESGKFELAEMGSWYAQMSNQKNMIEFKKAILEGYDKVKDTLHTHNTLHEKKLRDLTDDGIKVEKRNSITSWYNHVSELIRDICSNLDVMVEPAVYLDTKGLKTTLFNYFNQIMDVIEVGPDKYTPHLKRFEAPNMIGNMVLITPLPVCDMNVPRMY